MKALKQTNTDNPVNYLRVAHGETRKKLQAWADSYNETLKAENPQHYNKLRIKPCYLNTASEIIGMFNAYLDRIRKHGLEHTEFKINNPGLAKMMGAGTSEVTAYRHIKFLQRIGFITAKHFHGSHHDFGVELNEELLIAQPNLAFTAFLTEYHSLETNGELTVDKVFEIETQRPHFNGFFSKQWIATCKDSKASTYLENNNLDKAFCVDNSELAGASSELATVLELEHRSKTPQPNNEQEQAPPVAPAPPVKKTDLTPKQHEEVAERFISNSLTCMMAVLYPNYMMWQQENQLVKGYLKLYYANCKTYKAFADRSGEFTKRVVLTQNFILKYPNRYVPSPAKWLNPMNPTGFCGTKKWFEEWKTGEAQNKDYNANKKTLVEVMQRFEKTPDTKTFENGMRLLKKKRDTRLADMFSSFVLNRKETYTHEQFKKQLA